MTPTLQPSVQRWLQDHCESSVHVQGGLVIAAGGPGQNAGRTVAQWPMQGEMTPPLSAAAHAAYQRARPVVVAPSVVASPEAHNRIISLPLRDGEHTLGAVALAVRADSAQAMDALFKALEAASQDVSSSVLGAAPMAALRRSEDSPDQAAAGAQDAGQVLQLQDSFLRAATLREGALTLCGELAALLGCERVCLAVREDRHLQLLAMSGMADFKPQQDLSRLLTAAMQEAADQAARVVVPAPSVGPVRIVLAHAELQAHTGHAIASVAMVHARRVSGALLAEWRGNDTPSAAQLDLLEGVACALAPLISLRQQAEQSWLQRSQAALTKQLAAKGDPLPKLAAVAAVAAAVALCVVPVDFRVVAPARIEGAVQRVVAAPMEGFISKSSVRPGDTVKAGDVLVEMADQDLLLEQRKWEAALTQNENAVAAALARADRAQFVIAQGKASEAAAQLELVQQHLQRTKLLAPIDGVVIKGDLSQTLGAPVQKGDALLTVAPAQQYRLVVEVDERDVAHIRPGQAGQLALASLPAQPLRLVVERVTPVSVVREGRNVFEVQARLEATSVELRPGLQGVTRVHAGEASWAWIWGHRAVNWLRLTLWSWAP
jgi:multidrug resistance efflux pump